MPHARCKALAPFGAILAGALLSAAASGEAKAAQGCLELVPTVNAFMQAYARGDRQSLRGRVDPGVVLFGGDLDEVYRGRAGFDQMLSADQALWRGRASLGPVHDVAAVGDREFCVLTFHAPFTLDGGPTIQVRFTQAWRHTRAGWRLAQSANATPTVGQSATAILKGSGERRP